MRIALRTGVVLNNTERRPCPLLRVAVFLESASRIFILQMLMNQLLVFDERRS